MPLNFNPEFTQGRELQNNLRAVERHLADDHYIRPFAPADFGLKTATIFLADNVTHNDWPTVQMADGVNSHAAVSWRKPSEWRDGRLRAAFWYSSNVGSTNNFTIYQSMTAGKAGEVMPATSLLVSQSAVAGPAVAWTILRVADFYTTTSFGSDDEIFTWRIARLGGDAGDTNVNDFLLVYATIEHIPARMEES